MHKKLFIRLKPSKYILPDDLSRIRCNLDNDDLVFLAKFKDILVGYLVFNSKNSQIKNIFIYPEYRYQKIAKRLVHTLIFLCPNILGLDDEFFYKIGFIKLDNKMIVDPLKIDLIESPYNIKYKNIWYNTYSESIVKLSRNEIKSELLNLYTLGFFIPLQTDFTAVFNYNLLLKKEQLANSASIITTSSCNLSCNYCFEKNKGATIVTDSLIFEKLWQKILPRINDKFRLNFFGGEPTLNKEAIYFFTNKLRDYTKEKNYVYFLGMITNGTLCNNSFCDFFTNDEFSHIQITLDGPKEIHNLVRGQFDIILANTKNMLRITKSLGIRINVTKNNINSIDKLLLYLNDFYSFNEKQKIWVSIGFVYDNIKKINISKKQYLWLYGIFEKNNYFGFKFYKDPKDKIVICAASIGAPQWFDLTGNEYICEHLVGNENIKTNSIYLPKDCIMCKYYPVCGGICWSANLNHEPKWPYCLVTNKKVMYYVKKIYDKEKSKSE